MYNKEDLLQAKLDILSKTNMVDFEIDIRKMLYPEDDVPEVRHYLTWSFGVLNFLVIVV